MANDHPDVPLVPAPWQLKGEGWWFFTALFHWPKKGELAAPGYFDPLHAYSRTLATEDDAFLGSHGMIQLIRYADSPVGPYDELLIVPGSFKSPPGITPAKGVRITRIYVSTLNSVVNGRLNWNIPKSLAKFTFTPAADGSTAVQLFAPTSLADPSSMTFSDAPFFALTIRPTLRMLPAVPLNLKYSPVPSTLVQPPLEASPDSAHDGLVGTDRWVSVDISGYRGRVTPVRWRGGIAREGGAQGKARIADGEGFPDVVPYSIGMHLADLDLTFPEAVVLKEEGVPARAEQS